MKSKLKKYFPWIMVVLVTIFYFEYSVTVLWDSAHYMGYVNIFEGNLPWSSWDVVRGPVFPVIIYFGNILFGKTSQGLVMNTYLYYVIMLVFCYKILKEFFKDNKKYDVKKKNIIIGIFIFFMIICNPIIYGFYHSLLTEFVAITLSVISCYYAYRLLKEDFFSDKKKYCFYIVLFAFLTVFSWFLKQPYVSCGLFAFIISCLISIFEKKSIKNLLVRCCSILVCILVLGIVVTSWNKFLSFSGNNPDTDRNPTNSLGNQIVKAIDFLELNNQENIYREDYIEQSKLSNKEKKELLAKNNNDYVIINIVDNDEIIESDYVSATDGNISTLNSILYIMKLFVNRPIELINSYLTNYLSIIDVYSTETSDNIGYVSTGKIDLNFSNEIELVAYRPYAYGVSNIFYMIDELSERVQSYEQVNYAFKGLNYIMSKLGRLFLILFKVFFLILPFLLFLSILMRVCNKKIFVRKNKLNFIIILFSFSLLHLLLHTVTGALIDRYAIPAFVTTILGIFMFFYYFVNHIVIRKK